MDREGSPNTKQSMPVQGDHNIKLVSSLYVEKDPCRRCYKYIYPMELIGPIMGYRYHKQCFRCLICHTNLDFKSYRTNLNDLNDRSVYCASHYPRMGKYSGNYTFAETVEISRSNELINEVHNDHTVKKQDVIEKVFKGRDSIDIPIHSEMEHIPYEHYHNVKKAASTYQQREATVSHSPSLNQGHLPNRLPFIADKSYNSYSSSHSSINRINSFNNHPKNQYPNHDTAISHLNTILNDIVLHESLNADRRINDLKNKVQDTENLYYQHSNLTNVIKEVNDHSYRESNSIKASNNAIDAKTPVYWVSAVPKESVNLSSSVIIGETKYVTNQKTHPSFDNLYSAGNEIPIHKNEHEMPSSELTKIMKEAQDYLKTKGNSNLNHQYYTNNAAFEIKNSNNEPGFVKSNLFYIMKEIEDHEALIANSAFNKVYNSQRKLTEHEVHIVMPIGNSSNIQPSSLITIAKEAKIHPGSNQPNLTGGIPVFEAKEDFNLIQIAKEAKNHPVIDLKKNTNSTGDIPVFKSKEDYNLIEIAKEAKNHPVLTNPISKANLTGEMPVFKEKEDFNLIQIAKEAKSHPILASSISKTNPTGEIPVFKEKEDFNLIQIAKEAKEKAKNTAIPNITGEIPFFKEKENYNLITIMKEAKFFTRDSNKTSIKKSSTVEINQSQNEPNLKELINIVKEVNQPKIPNENNTEFDHFNNNPYMISIVKEMNSRKNSIVNSGNDTSNLSGIVSDIMQDDKNKLSKENSTESNSQLSKIFGEILENSSKKENSNDEKPSNLTKIANEIKTKENHAHSPNVSNLNKIATEIQNQSVLVKQKNPRQKASNKIKNDPNELTTSSIDIYANEKDNDETDSDSNHSAKIRAFTRLSSPDISDDAAKMKYANKPFTITGHLSLDLLNTPIGEKQSFGMLRLTAHYDELRSRLSITVHEAKNLKNVDKKTTSDPYARVFLLPDEKPTFKRKTKIIKDNLNPYWQETFDYPMTMASALSKELIVNIKDDSGIFERQSTKYLGEIQLKLKSVDIKEPFTRWFYLQPSKKTISKLLHQ